MALLVEQPRLHWVLDIYISKYVLLYASSNLYLNLNKSNFPQNLQTDKDLYILWHGAIGQFRKCPKVRSLDTSTALLLSGGGSTMWIMFLFWYLLSLFNGSFSLFDTYLVVFCIFLPKIDEKKKYI